MTTTKVRRIELYKLCSILLCIVNSAFIADVTS